MTADLTKDDEIGALQMRLEACDAEIERMHAFMKELSDALIKVRPLGGSELFVKRFGRHYADPKYCGAAIEETIRRLHEARIEAVRLWHASHLHEDQQ